MPASCSKKYTKKYTSRPGPPYPANECPEKTIRTGNDGNLYVNLPNKRGIKTWRMYKLRHSAKNGRMTKISSRKAPKKAAKKATKPKRKLPNKKSRTAKLLKCKKMYIGKRVVEVRVQGKDGYWRRATASTLARCKYH